MKRSIIIFLLSMLTLTLNAQKVGLVLSGGGAKGLYHVGMIKALEENGIPIDYVAGASMGAIVGAMYVAGYSPDEMLKFFMTDSVATWLEGKMPEEYNYYFKKFDPTPEIISVNINPDTVKLANVFELPTNIISPYRIDLAFIKMITPASAAAGGNFDSLMVPFRCVASDVYNKKLVTFDKGNLPFAVRASMTIPFAFKPLVYDSVLLYDGGLYNNFPWQTLDGNIKPDIYIGGICAGNNKNPSQSDLMGQVMTMISNPTDYNLPDSLDITIKRRFPDVGTLDYSRAAYIMACGYEDAMRQMPTILERIKRRVSVQEITEKRNRFKQKIEPLIYEDVEIEGLTPAQTEFVFRQLDFRGGNQLMTASRFEDRYMRVLATNIFTGEFPEVTFNPKTGYYRIKLKMQTQPSIKLSLGGNVSSSALNQLYLGAQYRTVGHAASTYAINGYLGTYFNAVDIGGRHDLYTRFPFYIDYSIGYEAVDNENYNSSAYYRNQRWRGIDHNDFYGVASLAVPFLKNSAFRVHLAAGVSKDRYYQDYYTALDKPSSTTFKYGSVSVETQSQSFNYPLYPTLGANQLVQFQFKTGVERYHAGTLPQAVVEGNNWHRTWIMARYMREQYVPIGKWFSMGYLFDGVFSTHPKFSNRIATAITLPTFAPTPFSQTIFMPEYRSASYVGVGIMPVINFTQDRKLSFKAYLYGFVPQEFVYDNGWQDMTIKRLKSHTQTIFGASFIYQSIIGPASLSVTKFSTGPANWNVVLNFGYSIFGKKH